MIFKKAFLCVSNQQRKLTSKKQVSLANNCFVIACAFLKRNDGIIDG